jgi:hypothetical protein
LQRLETTLFIQDKGTWHHGLFSFNHPPYFRDHKMSVITYVLWRTFGASIVLLVGSPRNILGEEAVIRDGVLIPGSNGAFFHLLDFIDNSIQTDEPYAVTWNRNIYGKHIRIHSYPRFNAKSSFKMDHLQEQYRDLDLDRYKSIYIGSPLYTAIV